MPNYEDPKEIYTFFGLAYYQAAVLEHGVLNLAVALRAKEGTGVTWDDVDRLYDSFDMKTFGPIIEIAREKVQFSDGLEADLATALSHRNYLAHRFFVVHADKLTSPGGRREMIDELRDILRQLQAVDVRMDELWISAWDSLGVRREWIEQEMERYASRRQANDA